MNQAPVAPAATLVIFGAMGDLAKRLLMPAIANLVRWNLLDPKTEILGVSYHDGDDETLRATLDDFIEGDEVWEKLRAHIHYFKGDFTQDETFQRLAGAIKGNAIFYLATAASFFGPVTQKLGAAGLLKEEDGFRRLVIEKPFGSDLASAQALNKTLLEQASEAQIYRIDHFLGKETVQNILVARFGNSIFEAVWNNRYVDHVEITAAEQVTVGTRGKFYDATGALRDMVPNHLLQLLALTAMEPPTSFEAEPIRSEKAKLIAAVHPADPADAVRGQYKGGKIGADKVAAYRETPDVSADSRTETYVALKLTVDTWRWSGVPFYLRTGKALSARDTEIVVHFKSAPTSLFKGTEVTKLPCNRFVLQIQPDEAISLDLAAKIPGPLVDVAPVSMTFAYADRFEMGHRTGYETLLYDVLTGDQILFQRADQIEGGWRAIQPLLDAWAKRGKPEPYKPGTAGPSGADALLARDGRQWHTLG
ncbi:glucose-6-phosphate dehydrogenase [Sphingomonas bacterium]|uniref:glucose-6-phosphate dehydrogenase n=1 Tax=Sphingomonas bacterium TaxID=1895847 RepID=UPI001575B2E5|nr:glucose-6-phosphate dehydrogenase [Sphingomonas bacterium]